jgi:hypothetical protein
MTEMEISPPPAPMASGRVSPGPSPGGKASAARLHRMSPLPSPNRARNDGARAAGYLDAAVAGSDTEGVTEGLLARLALAEAAVADKEAELRQSEQVGRQVRQAATGAQASAGLARAHAPRLLLP